METGFALKSLKLKKSAQRRFDTGHPWIFSNEVETSPKNFQVGELAQLVDTKGRFLAQGYTNPNSLILFRQLTRNPEESGLNTIDFFRTRLLSAFKRRARLNLNSFSVRLVFGEADHLPGLIIDRFTDGNDQVLVIQPNTGFMDQQTQNIHDALSTLVTEHPTLFQNISINRTHVLVDQSSAFRKHEGLDVTSQLKCLDPQNRSSDTFKIKLRSLRDATLNIDFSAAQKTGFFLDQQQNILLTQNLLAVTDQMTSSKIRILDLFSYVGQWGLSLGSHLNQSGMTCEIDFVDASADALHSCDINAQSLKLQSKTIKQDIIENPDFGNNQYDIVICDPPALIKNKKHFHQGVHGYLKANIGAMHAVKSGGLFVTCSCSGLLDESSFVDMLCKAQTKSQNQFQWIAKGQQSPDHPVLLGFPEGNYLKCLIGCKI